MVHALILACCLLHPLDRPRDWALVNLGLAAADYETALRVQGPNKPCYESDPLFGSPAPSRSTFYTRGLLVDGALEGFGWILWRRYRHKHHNVWRFPFVSVSTYHSYGIYTNLTCGRSLR